jgi:Raf kinase inhibitor-like YbhB/YbcL family protein
MRIHSQSFPPLGRIPGEYAYGVPGINRPAVDGANRNPQLAWEDAPAGTRSFALICVDDDVPSVFDDANQPGRSIARDFPRRDFIHWVMVDIPASLREIAAGSCSDGVVAGGKRNPPGPSGARQGVNDYGAGHLGYDGPCPPWNDERLHHYHFRLYALDLPTLAVSGHFSVADALRAMHGHVLGMAELTGVYSLNPALAA